MRKLAKALGHHLVIGGSKIADVEKKNSPCVMSNLNTGFPQICRLLIMLQLKYTLLELFGYTSIIWNIQLLLYIYIRHIHIYFSLGFTAALCLTLSGKCCRYAEDSWMREVRESGRWMDETWFINCGGTLQTVTLWYLNGIPQIKQPRGLLIQGWH